MADKKLFQLELGTPTDSDLIAYGKSGSNYKNITVAGFRAVMAGETGVLKTLVYTLLSWNMITNPIGLIIAFEPPVPPDIFGPIIEPHQIRSVSVMVRNDADTTWYDLSTQQGGSASSTPLVYIGKSAWFPTWTQVTFQRISGGFFSNSNFTKTENPDTSTYSRGYATITYVDS